ncbi:MAG: dephospho-CoA kinase [Pseudomonadota bacterium]
MSFVVGLTGGIGSGKSAAAECFAALGAAIVDTDAIAHALTGAGGAAIAALRDAFGPEALTPEGALDRAAMRQRAFADPAIRRRLEGILHPLIRAESERQVRRAAGSDFPYVVLVVPLLVESGGYRQRVDRVAVVDCPEATQAARVMARSGLEREAVATIMAAQAPRAARLAVADDVIDNAGMPEALRERVAALHARYLALAAAKRADRPESRD